MGPGARKSWSQETLALREHLAAPQARGFFTLERRALLLLALKTTMAAGLSYWLAALAGLQDGYWGSISAIIVLQSNVGSTVTASRDRLIGTLIGALFGGAFSLLGTSLWFYLLAVVTAMVICSLLELKNSSRLAGVTVTIIMLVHHSGLDWRTSWRSSWTLPFHRVLEVLLGIVVALAISTLVLPSRARVRLRDGLAQEFLMIGALFTAVLEGFRGEVAENLARLQSEVRSVTASNAVLRESARNEPSGEASLEALGMLDRYGAEIQELLHALELAIKADGDGGGEDRYAAQLEPELGRLVADVHRGFEYLAGCIHRWRFDEEPEGFSLEEDVARLDRKMAEIRPSGFRYPQGEILRAYAVQLHLKQLARLLRAARVECGGVVGVRD